MDNASTATKMPAWNKPFIWAGLICIGQFFFFAIIGVVQGYSVQSRVPHWVLLGGIFLLLPCLTCYGWLTGDQDVKKWGTRTSFLISFCLILTSVVGILQGRYQKQADEFYKQKNYPAAIAMYQKEVGTWYLRLMYNYREAPSLFGIARAYCQLGNFEKGCQAYQRLLKMAGGYYQERGQQELAELDTELKNIAELEEQLANAADDNQKAKILCDIALSYRKIECDNKAKEQYAFVQTLNAHESWLKSAKKWEDEIVLSK